MQIALVGLHPDGVDLALAFVASGRHAVPSVTVALPDHQAHALGGPRVVRDLEEVLADPSIEAVIVAGPPSLRPAQLRRVLQSERHAFCVHPLDGRADAAYEVSMLAADARCVLLPLLPEGLHPAIRRLGEFVTHGEEGPAGEFRLLTMERRARGEVLENAGLEGIKPSLPGWDILRAMGGEVAEVSAFADDEALEASLPILVAGRFEAGGAFQVTLLPNRSHACCRITVHGTRGEAELEFPQGFEGPAILGWRDAQGKEQEEYRERWDPWPLLVEQAETAMARTGRPLATWQDEVRALELDDAARHSVEKRRANRMEYQEANEEVGFKGLMTLVGCGMVWVVIGLLIASRTYPWAGWLILPLLLVFVALQLFRFIIPKQEPGDPASQPSGRNGGPEPPS